MKSKFGRQIVGSVEYVNNHFFHNTPQIGDYWIDPQDQSGLVVGWNEVEHFDSTIELEGVLDYLETVVECLCRR
jgi:hypothetical protein